MVGTKKVTKLRALRVANKLSVKELAEKSGLGESSIYQYERRVRAIPRGASIILCKSLGVDDYTNLDEIVEIDASSLHGNSGNSDMFD